MIKHDVNSRMDSEKRIQCIYSGQTTIADFTQFPNTFQGNTGLETWREMYYAKETINKQQQSMQHLRIPSKYLLDYSDVLRVSYCSNNLRNPSQIYMNFMKTCVCFIVSHGLTI